jgi:catechol 2,3-dioxygenase-like lactoylglutathione lyase family enzyme
MRIQLRWLAVVALGVGGCHVGDGASRGDLPPHRESAAVRYEVSHVQEAVAFYEQLGFDVLRCEHSLAVLHRGDLTLMLEAPRTPGNKPAVDAVPEDSNAWNRIVLYVDNLRAQRERLKRSGCAIRPSAPESKSIVVSDPDGNPIEIRQLGSPVAWQ